MKQSQIEIDVVIEIHDDIEIFVVVVEFERVNNDEVNSKRTDAYGTLINHKNKRNVKVTFKDRVEEKQPLIEIINIESYKQYNFMENISTLSEREAFHKERTCCSCIII